MSKNSPQTTYLCPKCDRVYYSVDRNTWESNRVKHNAIAKSLKNKHQCPWERKRNSKKGE